MRGLAAVAVVAVVLIGAVLYLRSGAPEEDAASYAPVARPQAPKAKERSARVEERLSELRDDFDHRQAAPNSLAPSKREVPTMAAQKRVMEDSGYEDEEEDPQEMEELKVTLLSDPDPDERIGAVLMLTGEEGPESLRMLLEAMDDPDPEVRLAVVEALGDRAEEISPATLNPALRDPDAEVRFEAVSILGDMDSSEARQMVRSALGDEDEDVRALAEGIEDFDEDEDDEDEDDAMNGNPVPQPTAPQHGQARR
jgi:HEAT repeat protein